MSRKDGKKKWLSLSSVSCYAPLNCKMFLSCFLIKMSRDDSSSYREKKGPLSECSCPLLQFQIPPGGYALCSEYHRFNIYLLFYWLCYSFTLLRLSLQFLFLGFTMLSFVDCYPLLTRLAFRSFVSSSVEEY